MRETKERQSRKRSDLFIYFLKSNFNSFQSYSGKYCGGSEYACRYGYYCDDETSKCEPLSTYSGHKPACDSLNVTSCPLGYKCGCAGLFFYSFFFILFFFFFFSFLFDL